jgi:hypothetical protein
MFATGKQAVSPDTTLREGIVDAGRSGKTFLDHEKKVRPLLTSL